MQEEDLIMLVLVLQIVVMALILNIMVDLA
jgi:hypothetical protein